jgi:uncharacterized protein (DUF305 family)
MQNKIGYIGIGLLAGIILTWVFTSVAINNQNNGMMRMMGIRSPQARVNAIDQHFIEQMIPHHDDAITMANLAAQRAEHAEIKSLAQDIAKAQSSEITEMRQWYKDWFGREVPDTFASMGHGMGSGSMHMGMMGSSTDTKNLESASPFDKAFIEEMIPHHQMAVMMAQMLKNSTERPDMRKLADDIITAQNKEIEQMRAWYAQWYK